ncbi:MAG TPA: ribonuclease H-like domain-containing protein, partial [Blastocatellia bacterium]|nr:ribonuclease H-like domain-containing protein [Blastocatellia bacterium]
MLKQTFCHLPGIGPVKERNLWAAGIRSWDALLGAAAFGLPRIRVASLSRHIEESYRHLETGDPAHFAERLAADQHWRLFADFRHSIAYLDIETTGLGYGDHITTIAIYDGQSVFHYIHNQNLNDFIADIRRYRLLVTYNGKCFDVPFIENQFGIRMTQAHIDLRYVLGSLGYRGGLKG